jgi:CRP-like cAMP-binding protein
MIDSFSSEDISLFMNSLERVVLEKGEHFLREGQVSHHLAYIESGLAMYYMLNDGVEVPCDFGQENQWLAHLKSFTNRAPSEMYIKMLEDTVLHRLSYQDMIKLFTIQPKFQGLKNYYTELSLIDLTQHGTDLAMLPAKERYYKFMKEKPSLVNRVPQYYIAAYLGIKPQSLSRIRKEG